MIVTGQQVVDWAAAVAKHWNKYGHGAVGIGVARDGIIIGAAVFNNYTGADIHVHAVSNGKKSWLTREFLWFVHYYAFHQVGVRRITGFIWESNTSAVELAKRLGAELEARLSDAADDGDVLIFKMTKNQCKWLKRKHK